MSREEIIRNSEENMKVPREEILRNNEEIIRNSEVKIRNLKENSFVSLRKKHGMRSNFIKISIQLFPCDSLIFP